MRSSLRSARTCGSLILVVLASAGCQPGDVDARLRELPSWSAFSPLREDVAPQPVEGGQVTTTERNQVMTTITDQDDDGDGVADVEILDNVVSRCTSVPYTMTDTPERIVMYSPDVELLWPGALLQGRSHRDGLGSLSPLPIAQRASLEVSIPGFSTGDNFRLVEQPTQAQVSGAIGSIVQGAVASDLVSPSTITFEEKTYHSEGEFALSLDMSGRYLGFEASASGDVEQSASMTTITAQFYQKMFEVVVAPPATPAAIFSPDFTEAAYQEQVDLGRIGPDNLPIYVSNVVYGRMMTFSLTSTASESEIRATLSAAYDGLVGGVEASLDARQKAILAESTIAVSSLGGDAEATIAMIRSGNWEAYFDANAPLSSAAPLSYTFRNLGDNTIATVSEATEFTITSCVSRAAGDVFDFVEEAAFEAPIDPPFETHAGDFDGDGYDDVLWNHLEAGENTFVVGYGGPGGGLDLGTPQVHPAGDPVGGWPTYRVLVGDVDADGRDDVVWSRVDRENSWAVARFEGRDAVVFDAVTEHGVQGWGTYVANLGDVDGDGRDDLHWAQEVPDRFRVYTGVRYTPEAGFELQPHHDVSQELGDAPWSRNADIVLGDYDGDGDDDLVIGAYLTVQGSDYHFVYVAESDRSSQVHPALTGVAFVDVAAAGSLGDWRLLVDSFTGAAADDLLSIPVGPQVSAPEVYLIDVVGETSTAEVGPAIEGFGDFGVFEGDIDGDGRQDVVWNRRDGPDNEIVVGFGRTEGFDLGGSPQPHAWPVPDWDAYDAPLVLDVNGDGRDDLLWSRSGPTIRVHVALASAGL